MRSHTITLIDNELVTISLQFVSDAEPLVHFTYNKKPTKSVYRWTKEFTNNLAIELGVFGITHMFALYDKEDLKAQKFARNMGFKQTAELESGKVVMALEI